MISGLRERLRQRYPVSGLVIVAVLAVTLLLGRWASPRWLALLVAAAGALALLRVPQLGPLALITAALVVRLEIGTGTDVELNAATLLVPVLFGLQFIKGLRTRQLRWVGSTANTPLTYFLAAGLLSLLLGNVLWDPAVPKPDSFWLTQAAQWATFALAALAFWLLATLEDADTWLPRLTWFLLILAGGLYILLVVPAIPNKNVYDAVLVIRLATPGLYHPPLLVLVVALAGGQLLFTETLSSGRRVFLIVAVAAVLIYAFYLERETVSNWVGVSATLGTLIWLRWPRLRWLAMVVLVALTLSGLLTSTVYDFAGGDREWVRSGGSRLVLIERVVDVTMRNPVTGLGPAAYRPYAGVEPLPYEGALWVNPNVSSHNNYVDLFSHVGLLGLGLFIWFAAEMTLLGFRLRTKYTEGFFAGYVNGMIAAWAGALVLMLFGDWMLPFVYNIGFPGFQASLLVWLFLGGLVGVDATGDAKVRE